MTELFNTDRLLSIATRQTGLSDLNGDTWRIGLDRIVAALNERPVTEDGRQRIEHDLVRTLTSRLKIEEWYAANPQAENDVVDGPVFIFGLPRTATTALQNNLSVDPHWRFLRGWEANEPVPPPELETELQDERYLREKEFIDNDTTYIGQHIHAAGGPVEDTAIHRLNFGGQEHGWPVNDYTTWWRNQPQLDTFKYQRRVLRLLQSKRPPNSWVLKSPWYSFHLGDLRRAYPNAKFVMTHRNPRKVIPSAASLHYVRYHLFLDEADFSKKEIGRQALEHWSDGMAKAMEYRRQNPDDEIFDIYHQDFNEHPLENLERLYDWLGVPMTAAVEKSMREWATTNRAGTYGKHEYTAEEYGVTESEIDAAFADYNQTFGH